MKRPAAAHRRGPVVTRTVWIVLVKWVILVGLAVAFGADWPHDTSTTSEAEGWVMLVVLVLVCVAINFAVVATLIRPVRLSPFAVSIAGIMTAFLILFELGFLGADLFRDEFGLVASKRTDSFLGLESIVEDLIRDYWRGTISTETLLARADGAPELARWRVRIMLGVLMLGTLPFVVILTRTPDPADLPGWGETAKRVGVWVAVLVAVGVVYAVVPLWVSR